jgi:hypothetical protein
MIARFTRVLALQGGATVTMLFLTLRGTRKMLRVLAIRFLQSQLESGSWWWSYRVLK